MMLKRFLKNERGLTLIELLAVVVILGIIAAIAVPSIGGIIDNTKKDAHVSNAQQMVSAAKIAVSAEPDLLPISGSSWLPLAYLVTGGYVDAFDDPDGGDYAQGDADTRAEVDALTAAPGDSYVQITKNGSVYEYRVVLEGSKRTIGKTAAVQDSALSRTSVEDN